MNLNNIKLSEQLIIFVELSKDMSFTKTAQRISVSKGYISKHIKELENNLNIKLFHRTTRLVTLTAEGKVILDEAKKIVNKVENILDFSSMKDINFVEELTISCPVSFGIHYITNICEGFSEKYPEIKLNILLTNNFMSLADDNIDVVIRISKDIDGLLIAKQITSIQEVVCASSNYFKNHSRITKPNDLKNHNCLYYMNPNQIKTWRFIENNKELNISIKGNASANLHKILVDMATKDKGIIRVPNYTAQNDLQLGNLKEILTNYKPTPIPVYAGYLQHKFTPLRIKIFIEFLKDFFTK